MSNHKEGFVLYTGYYASIKTLSNAKLGKLLKIIFEYQIDGTLPNDSIDSDVKMAFGFIQNQFRVDGKKREDFREMQRQKGILSAKKRYGKSVKITSSPSKNLTAVNHGQPRLTYKGKGKGKGKIERANKEFLKKIPNKYMEKYIKDFSLTSDVVIAEGEKAYDWLQSKEKTYKNYSAFFRNWLRNKQEFQKSNTKKKTPMTGSTMTNKELEAKIF